MSITTWLDILILDEKHIEENIKAIAISNEPYYKEDYDMTYDVFFEDNLDGIKTVTDENIRKCITTVFDRGFGAPMGFPFTAWTDNYVIFPTEYDGAESTGIVPRNPCKTATRHI